MSNVALKKLTDKQMALVDIMVTQGLKPAQAAEIAGYAAGKAGYVSAYRSLKLPHVQQYMMQRMNEEFGLSAVAALNTTRRLSQSAKSEYVQLQASQDLLDRAGYKPIDRSQVQVAGDIKVSIDLS
jgi:phage terminase small subunit